MSIYIRLFFIFYYYILKIKFIIKTIAKNKT